MISEQECKPQERYLFTHELFSDKSVAIWQGECISRHGSRKMERGSAYEKFIKWERKENEIALFTLYAYAEISIPKRFDCIFDLDNPERFVITDFTLTQSIFEAWYPINSIEPGHKHLCVFEFEEKIPELISELHIATGKFSNAPKGAIGLGICLEHDFEQVKKRIIHTLELRKNHGQDWWKYDKQQ